MKTDTECRNPAYMPPPESWTYNYSRGCAWEWHDHTCWTRAHYNRPCSSVKKNQCRERGPSQMPPEPWDPSHGWLLMPFTYDT